MATRNAADDCMGRLRRVLKRLIAVDRHSPLPALGEQAGGEGRPLPQTVVVVVVPVTVVSSVFQVPSRVVMV